MKKALLALAVAGAAVSAQADTKLSGHVNYVFGDTGDLTDAANGTTANDNFTVQSGSNSESRFRIISTKKADGITYGSRQEIGLRTANGGVNVRNNYFWIGGDFGKFSVGQQSEAGDGATEADFSGSYVLTGAAYNTWGLATGGGTTRITQLDGGRDQAIKYTSPKLGGLASVALSLDQAENTNIALSLGGSNWKAGLFNVSVDKGQADIFGGSIAGKFGPITAAYQFGEQDPSAAGETDDVDYTKIILGYKAGPLSVALDVATNENDANTLDHETNGVSVVYRPTKGVELYAGIREYEDKDATPTTDGDGFLMGGRVKF